MACTAMNNIELEAQLTRILNKLQFVRSTAKLSCYIEQELALAIGEVKELQTVLRDRIAEGKGPYS
jgi:hypothetical protein